MFVCRTTKGNNQQNQKHKTAHFGGVLLVSQRLVTEGGQGKLTNHFELPVPSTSSIDSMHNTIKIALDCFILG